MASGTDLQKEVKKIEEYTRIMKDAVNKGRKDPTYYRHMNAHCKLECNNIERSLSKIRDLLDESVSASIIALQQRQEHARWIAKWIDEDWNNWYKLKEKDRLLWNEYSNGDIAREIKKLRIQQQSRFPGAVEIIATSMQSLSPLP